MARVMSYDIEDDPVDALAMLTIMYNDMTLKRPDHLYVKYCVEIDRAIRKQRELLNKQEGEIAQLKQQINRL